MLLESLSQIDAGRAEDAVPLFERAMRLDPYYPARYLYALGLARFGMGQLADAAALMERAYERNPEWKAPQLYLAVFYALMDRNAEAQAALKSFAKQKETKVRFLSVHFVLTRVPFWDPRAAERFGTGLVKAGMCCQEQVDRHLELLRELRSPE